MITSLLSLSEKAEKSLESKSTKKYTILFWIDTKEFNVVPLSRVPKDKRMEGSIATLKAERKLWQVKLVKVEGKSK